MIISCVIMCDGSMSGKKYISGKKAFLKVLEVFLAITIVFVFMIITQNKNLIQSNNLDYNILGFKSSDSGFRDKIYSMNNQCVKKGAGNPINIEIEEILPTYLNYTVCVYDDPKFRIDDLPDKKIFVDSYYFSSDEFSYRPKVAKIFYWK
jgi:hypothetical protein